MSSDSRVLGELERKINILETFAVFVRKVSEKIRMLTTHFVKVDIDMHSL